MKLKNVLMITFLVITVIPIVIVSVLWYSSGFKLSKESYTRNLIESLNVQADYIAQTTENNMITDNRFARQTITTQNVTSENTSAVRSELFTAINAYLGAAEDKVSICVLLDNEHKPIYSIGENGSVDAIKLQIPKPAALKGQTIMEFELGDGTHSLGIVTPVWEQEKYVGCLVSIYDKSYIFKIISSYYETADTSTYICRENGDVISSRQLADENSDVMQEVLHGIKFSGEDIIKVREGDVAISGYYKNIHNTPWYLVGFVDDALIYSFTNQYLLVYILVIIAILVVDIVLSLYFSRRVVKPINNLIKVMEGYQNSLDGKELQYQEEDGYVETKYLRTKFLELMKKILLVQHNFEGVYELYQSNDTGDINIDIDVTNQTIACNKTDFQNLIDSVQIAKDICIVEKFTKCFCDKDQVLLLTMLEGMRDEHLSTTQEAEVYTASLNQRWFHALVVPMYTNERLSRLFVQLRDISSFKKSEIESSEQAKRDSLTGLYNRAGFTALAEKAMQNGKEQDLHALLFIDMDYFKMVNDNLGHTQGDEVLRSVSNTLSKIFGPQDIVSRFGGDEFVVFLPSTSMQDVSLIIQELKKTLIFPFKTDLISFVVSASVGVSSWQYSKESKLQEYLQKADAEMYKAKREFKQMHNM